MTQREKVLVIIIVTFNGQEFIEQCLQSCLSIAPKTNIYVIDNNSQDRTKDIVQRLGVNLIPLENNVGFGAANNIGIQQASTVAQPDYYLLLNQDAYLDKSAWTNFCDLPETVKKDVVAFMQLNGTGTELDHTFRQHVLSPAHCPYFVQDLYFNRLSKYYEIEFAGAAAWVLPTEIVRLVGGFSPFFFHYGEDVNLSHRLKYFQRKMYLAPFSVIRHDRKEFNRPYQKYYKAAQKAERQVRLQIANPINSHSACHLIWIYGRRIIKNLLLLRSLDQESKAFLKLWRRGELRRGLSTRAESVGKHVGNPPFLPNLKA